MLVPTCEFIQKLCAARLAADVMGVPTIIVARTDALGAYLLTSDIDDRDKPFCKGERLPQPWGWAKHFGTLPSTPHGSIVFSSRAPQAASSQRRVRVIRDTHASGP